MIAILVTIYLVMGLTFIFALAFAARSQNRLEDGEGEARPVSMKTKAKFNPVLKILPPTLEWPPVRKPPEPTPKRVGKRF